MNRIKIVSGEGFKTMKISKKDYEVSMDDKVGLRHMKRPLTPKEVFKYVER
jgi:hypothetical protein